jgi:putative phosphoribosyl transferase
MIHVLPRPIFADRRDAGRRQALASRAEPGEALVLGLARGGVLVAAEVARALSAPLDVLVVRKLGAPQSEELAIGAVTADGGLFLMDEIIRWLEIPPAYVEREVEKQRELASRREALYRLGRPGPQLAGRHVILVDDGMATGATMVAAARSVRQQGAAFVQVAVPVGAQGSCADLRGEADDVTCLHQPEPFWAVGFFYEDFSQVEDDDVLKALEEGRDAATSAP